MIDWNKEWNKIQDRGNVMDRSKALDSVSNPDNVEDEQIDEALLQKDITATESLRNGTLTIQYRGKDDPKFYTAPFLDGNYSDIAGITFYPSENCPESEKIRFIQLVKLRFKGNPYEIGINNRATISFGKKWKDADIESMFREQWQTKYFSDKDLYYARQFKGLDKIKTKNKFWVDHVASDLPYKIREEETDPIVEPHVDFAASEVMINIIGKKIGSIRDQAQTQDVPGANFPSKYDFLTFAVNENLVILASVQWGFTIDVDKNSVLRLSGAYHKIPEIMDKDNKKQNNISQNTAQNELYDAVEKFNQYYNNDL